MEFTNISQKAYVLEAKVTGGNSAKNQQFFLNLEKQQGAQKAMKKLLLMIKQL